MPNRLAQESSPYLQQHADNPVDWYPWGAEAFARAKAENKPVFVSIGYAACHWCHVMAHESFDDAATAELMNELFVNVKVDREERPDVDQVYMTAIQVMGQGGGWPLSAFCTPDGKPYFLGTYFPPTDKFGRPGFPRLLKIMARLYEEERDKVEHNTAAILEGLQKIDEHYRGKEGGSIAALSDDMLVQVGAWISQRCDAVHGGFGGAPKFPSSSTHELLARAGRMRQGEAAREAYLAWAMSMARGGIYDHLGGGFARYSVDAEWLVPHFEKMLYDNAQLLSIYGDAFAMTNEPTYAEVIEETIGWLEREMLDASGGLYASQDADSEGEEGRYYVWTPEQIVEALGEDDARQFCRDYGVTPNGNFEHGTTVLSRVTPRGTDDEERALAASRETLFAVRDRRVHPDTDTKVLAGWNALAIIGLVRAWEATGHEPALALALRVANFLAETMLHEADGGTRIWRVYKNGKTSLDGTIDDYAFSALAFMQLAEATGEAAHWQRGSALLDAVVERFYEEGDGIGVFYMTPGDADETLVHRPESHHDGAIPSGAGVALLALLRRGLVAGDVQSLDIAEAYLGRRTQEINPVASSTLVAAADLYLHGAELVVTEGEGRELLLEAARAAYAPTCMIAGPWAAASILAGKQAAADGRAQAFVCRGQSCSPPVADVAELVKLLTSH